MKRFLCVIFVLCLIFTGCAENTANTDESTLEPSETAFYESADESGEQDAGAGIKENTDGSKADSEEKEFIDRAYFSVSLAEEKEFILDLTMVELKENDTALGILKRLMKEHKIHMETGGSGDLEYVKGIDNIYEFDAGPQSGWVFYVNNEMPLESAGKMKVKDGDMVDWVYITKWSEKE